MRKVYLNNIPRTEALERFLREVEIPRKEEEVPLREALGRVTSRPVTAALSMPGFHSAAMDGIAVSSVKTFNASDQNPLRLKKGKDFAFIDTGNPLPKGCDAVIKIEEVHFPDVDDETAEILAPAGPWQHVRPVGEDVVAGELIVSSHHRLRPADLGALAAGGISSIKVLKKPSIVVIPTGSDLVPAHGKRPPGAVPDFNSIAIEAYLKDWGAKPTVRPIVEDDFSALSEAIQEASINADMVLIIAGSSAGRKDYTYHVIKELGHVFVHGVATKPGKPTILGMVNDKPAVGLPGYPVSAYMSLDWFVRPQINRYLGQAENSESTENKMKARLGRRVVSSMGSEEHVRMSAGFVNGGYVATPLARGAGVTMSMVRAEGLLIIPPESLGYEQDEEVELQLLKPASAIKKNLLVAGSHDLIIDLLATAVREKNPELSLSSAHVGSMGGIVAVGGGRAHFAGIHLFDPESGEYNIPYVKRYLSSMETVLMTLAYRTQGWIVPKGNPDKVEGPSEIATQKLLFVNRQKGAGTRLLFDHLLKESGIDKSRIRGYRREEHTHLNVAAAVAAETARVGLGILPAAAAFSLDFVPVGEERYDLLMTRSFFESPNGKLIVNIITDRDFIRKVENMGGYSMREAGMVRES